MNMNREQEHLGICDSKVPGKQVTGDSYDPSVDTNPKKQFGDLKAPFNYFPVSAIAEMALIMALGAEKYGAFNFRDTIIDTDTYTAAINRHFALWQDGEDNDPDGGLHLAAIMASCSLMIDAMKTGKLKDVRSKTGTVREALDNTAREFNERTRTDNRRRSWNIGDQAIVEPEATKAQVMEDIMTRLDKELELPEETETPCYLFCGPDGIEEIPKEPEEPKEPKDLGAGYHLHVRPDGSEVIRRFKNE